MTAEQQHDLLLQQSWLAGQVMNTAAQEAAAAEATASPTAWLEQQRELLKQQQTAFLIQQEQQRMTFMVQQQKQFEMQTRAVMMQAEQQQTPQQPVTFSEASLHGMMGPGPVQDAMRLQKEQVEAFQAQQEQEQQQKMEAERRAEEQRLEEERRFLQDQQELLCWKLRRRQTVWNERPLRRRGSWLRSCIGSRSKLRP